MQQNAQSAENPAAPALFYFSEHNIPEQLDTPVLAGLIERADVIYMEFASDTEDDLSSAERKEKILNAYSISGIISTPELQAVLNNPQHHVSIFLRQTRGTQKRYVVERTQPPPFDYEAEDKRTHAAFFDYPLERAMEMRRAFLERAVPYYDDVEHAVAQQIAAIPEAVLVSFGAGHPELPELVTGRLVEVHYPFEDFPVTYGTKQELHFKRTGKLSEELYLRSRMEMFARAGLRKSGLPHHDIVRLAHHYASAFTPEQILGYRDRVLSYANTGVLVPRGYFESYLRGCGIPQVREDVNRE